MNCDEQKRLCDSLAGHLQIICRGERRDLSLSTANSYRNYWGFPPLNSDCVESPEESHPVEQSALPLIIRGLNFATAMARWAAAGMPRRSQEEINERLAICQTCEFLKNNHCTKCGCACVEKNQLINKLALKTEKCPENKWS